MTCLVTGFPSKIAALQFEWAWQNPGLTRHIAPDVRITQAKMTTRISPRTGKTRKRSARPRISLTDRIANLHLLLEANSFRRWPLHLVFYDKGVFRVWQKWTSERSSTLPITVVLDETGPVTDPALKPSGIQGLDVTYASSKSHIAKSSEIFSGNRSAQSCSICHEQLHPTGAGALVCPYDGCASMTHLQCLSASFLKEDQAGDSDAIVPTSGHCPDCHSELRWVNLVKDLSLRMRGQKEIQALFKPKRAREAKKGGTLAAVAAETSDDESVASRLEEEMGIISESSGDEAAVGVAARGPSRSRSSAVFKQPTALSRLSERVIEDSDCEAAESIT